MADTPATKEKLHEDGLIGHLTDLRNSVVWSIVVFAVVFFAMFAFAQEVYDLFAKPLLAELPQGSELIATGVTAGLLVPLKVVAFIAFCITLPHTLYQLWRFIAPGLYRKEKGIVIPLVISSTFLFFLGMCFAFFVVFRLVFGFIFTFAPESMTVMPDVDSYFGFALLLFIVFGIAFEMPIAVFILVRAGLVEIDSLKKNRSYVVVGAFIVSAIITPPDVISQVLLAVPVCLLYEIGIQVSRWFPPPKGEDDED